MNLIVRFGNTRDDLICRCYKWADTRCFLWCDFKSLIPRSIYLAITPCIQCLLPWQSNAVVPGVPLYRKQSSRKRFRQYCGNSHFIISVHESGWLVARFLVSSEPQRLFYIPPKLHVRLIMINSPSQTRLNFCALTRKSRFWYLIVSQWDERPYLNTPLPPPLFAALNSID